MLLRVGTIFIDSIYIQFHTNIRETFEDIYYQPSGCCYTYDAGGNCHCNDGDDYDYDFLCNFTITKID